MIDLIKGMIKEEILKSNNSDTKEVLKNLLLKIEKLKKVEKEIDKSPSLFEGVYYDS